MLDKNDEELMLMYQTGSEEAFKILYDLHSAKVYGFIIAKVRNQEKAHDIFQEVFTKVHKSKNLYNKSFPFLPWLFTITKNTLIDQVRKAAYEKNQVEVEDSIPAPEPELALVKVEVTPHLEKLPQNQRKTFELRYFEEKSFDEISQALNTSPVNVRKLLSRGLKRMKELITEEKKS